MDAETATGGKRLVALANPPGMLPDDLIPEPPKTLRSKHRERWRRRFRASVSAYCLEATARRALRLEQGMSEPEQYREMRRCLAGEQPWPAYVIDGAMDFSYKRGSRAWDKYLRRLTATTEDHERAVTAAGAEY